MPEKPLLTPQQIAEKFIKVNNPFCGTEKRAVRDIQGDLVIYIQMAVDAAVKKRETELSTVTNY
jgi:hypothetical protein